MFKWFELSDCDKCVSFKWRAIKCLQILKFGGPDPAWPRAPKSGGSADPADPVLPTPLLTDICSTPFHVDTTKASAVNVI